MRELKTIATPAQILEAMSGKEMSFTQYYPDKNKIIIREITLNEDLEINDITCQAFIDFVNCDLNGVINIRGGTFNGFSISGGRITKPLIIYGGTFNKSFRLAEVDALAMRNEGYVSVGFWGGEFNCNVSIYKGAFQFISLRGSALKSVSIQTGAVSYYNHDLKPYIKKLELSPKQIDVLEIENFKIERLELCGILENGLYSFENVTLNELDLHSFLNRGRLLFNNLKVFTVRESEKTLEPSLSMAHAHLGETRFSQTDFAKFAKIEISDSTFTDVESSNTNWFSAAQLNNLRDEDKRDLFRQLKHAMIRQGNRIDELYFQALEMEAYRRTLSIKENFWDLFILSIGKYTNNFGTNYVLPVIWILVMSFLIFQCSLWALGLSFSDRWGSLFVVMNPAHSTDYLVPKDKLSNLFMAVDFAGRVIISILIYQLITPFRKFARG